MKRQAICQAIEDAGVVPIIRTHSSELALRAARAVYAGGIHVVEITMAVPDALKLVELLSAEFGRDVLLGVGTVLDAATARACIAAGAQFIVAPGFDPQTVQAVHELDRAVLPGALTPTEIISAWKAGADIVKVFPCGAVGGAAYIRALRAPLPQVKLMPTEGVTLENVPEFIAAGAAALGVGRHVIDLGLLERQGEVAASQKVRAFAEAIVRARCSRKHPEGSLP
jgi:2-dehydro-3-deoxyphosphogluconate aldolase/(4S)-4-hydroxy-2-oxoglutarate aldolase